MVFSDGSQCMFSLRNKENLSQNYPQNTLLSGALKQLCDFLLLSHGIIYISHIYSGMNFKSYQNIVTVLALNVKK